MTTTRRLLAFSGSLRQDSYNQRLLHVACQAARQLGAEVTEVSLREYDLPLFSEDLEQQATPAQVTTFKQQVAAADGLLIACPEYNGSFTAALKNAIDWLSRPDTDPALKGVLSGKWVALMAASPGGLGGLRGLNHVRDVLFNLGALVLPKPVALGQAHQAFSESGTLQQPDQQARLDAAVSALVQQLG